jgi:hypothetical protein
MFDVDDETRAAIMWQECAAADFRYAQMCDFEPEKKILWMDFAAKASENARRHLWNLVRGGDEN